MIELELSNEAFEEIRDKCIAAGLIVDEPSEWNEDAKPFTVGGITFREWKYVPTPEEIERDRLFRESPLGKLTAEMFKRSNEAAVAMILDQKVDILFAKGDEKNDYQWPEAKIGSELRIRLPNDYIPNRVFRKEDF